jgi:hypothetical protein
MTKDELFEIFDKYDTYEFIKEGESIHSIKWADLNGLADELVKLFAIPEVSGSYCMYCEKELKPDEAIILCKKCTE